MTPFSDLMKKHELERVEGICEEHGAFATVRLRGTDAATCPKCFAAKIAKESAEAAFRTRVAHLREISHIPERFAETGFASFRCTNPKMQKAIEETQVFMRKVRNEQVAHVWRTMMLTGVPGTGKTHLACALANNLVSRGVSVRYTTAPEMLADIKRAYSTDGMTEASQIDRYVSAHSLLILDEIDVMRIGNDNDTGLLFAVINGRYNANRPVVVVSNQPAAALGAFVSDRVASRLMENSIHIVCDWADFRRSNAVS